MENERRGRHRLWNHDECPQAFCYNGDKGKDRQQMGCSVDDDGSCDVQPTTTIAACKDQMTIHEMANAEGAFGPWHLLHDAAAHMENMAPANMADMGGGLVSTTAAGQQTGESLLEYYKVFNASLEKELSSSFTCIDDGKWKVTKPIMIVADGHASRYDANVLQYCEDEELYQCIEPGQTSAFLQMLDQIFKNLHQAYNRGCKELARWHSTTYHEAVAKYNVAVKEFPGEMHEKPSLKTVNRYDATQVFGKDHGEAGPTWVNRASVQAAWRVVGVTSSAFDVSAIPAGRLVDDMAVTAAGIPGAAEHFAYVSPDRPRREHLIAMDIPSPCVAHDNLDSLKRKFTASKVCLAECMDFIENPAPIPPHALSAITTTSTPLWYYEGAPSERSSCRVIKNPNLVTGSMESKDMVYVKGGRKNVDRVTKAASADKVNELRVRYNFCHGVHGCHCEGDCANKQLILCDNAKCGKINTAGKICGKAACVKLRAKVAAAAPAVTTTASS